jgi:hypothetical protein
MAGERLLQSGNGQGFAKLPGTSEKPGLVARLYHLGQIGCFIDVNTAVLYDLTKRLSADS